MPREASEGERISNYQRDNPGIRVPPPLIYVLPFILGLVLDRRSHVSYLPHRLGRLFGWPLIGGVLLSRWFLQTMRQANAPVRTDRPMPRLTTKVPFRYTRNPGYLSLTMLYAGIAVLRNALWPILLLPLVLYVIQREVIEREERYLERTFGEGRSSANFALQGSPECAECIDARFVEHLLYSP